MTNTITATLVGTIENYDLHVVVTRPNGEWIDVWDHKPADSQTIADSLNGEQDDPDHIKAILDELIDEGTILEDTRDVIFVALYC